MLETQQFFLESGSVANMRQLSHVNQRKIAIPVWQMRTEPKMGSGALKQTWRPLVELLGLGFVSSGVHAIAECQLTTACCRKHPLLHSWGKPDGRPISWRRVLGIHTLLTASQQVPNECEGECVEGGGGGWGGVGRAGFRRFHGS